jgi:excisionase family DNA binding protein
VSNADNNHLMDIRDVAEWTGLSVGTLYHLISQRRIPVVRISSRCIRFRKSDIEQWLAEKVVPAQNPCILWRTRERGKHEKC